MTSEAPIGHVFGRALDGREVTVSGLPGGPVPLPVDAWTGGADEHDLALLGLCHGATLDIGCGPGRMVEALALRGHVALGIDVVDHAVAMTLDRGVPAVLGDVFGAVPDEGRWDTVLLADGNIGIGGDPALLLKRVGDLLAPHGRAVVELAGPGVDSVTAQVTISDAEHHTRPFPWAVVGLDDAPRLAASAGMTVRDMHPLGSRWAAVLERA